MLSRTNHGTTLTALIASAVITTLAHGGQVSFSDTVPLTTTNWQQSVTLGRFDPALGDLLGVQLTLEAHNEGTAAFENQDAAPAVVTMTFATHIELQRQDTTALLIAEPSVTTVDNATSFDGTLDFAGPSGKSYPNLSQTVSQSQTFTCPVPECVLFSGPAGNPGTVTLPVIAVGQSTGSGAGNLTLAFTSRASAIVTVTYLYAPDCNQNDVPDETDIANGTSHDCDHNGVPDECQPDCDADGTPDVCEPDCDHDGTPDDCDKTPCPECKEINRRTPGSLLLYPEFDNRDGQITLVTVTNTNCNELDGGVDVEFVYIGRFGPGHTDVPCLETNRTRHLSACDTLTLWTRADNPNYEQGYLYAFAKNAATGQAIVFNHLIGEEMFMSPINTLDDGLSALVFHGLGEERANTDRDADGIRDLDGVEYDEAPAELLIPRFLGQDAGNRKGPFTSRLVLIGLSGGTAFTTSVDFLVYNDNEEVFSAQYTFYCWEDPRLSQINNVFTQEFLASTSHAPSEILGLPERESGWFKVNGLLAQSTQAEVVDPAIYAVLIERVAPYSVADLPWELCSQTNGDLLPTSLFGDQ
ncbi:MAG: choice-of-anchor E domain-containing protein [Planctomycetota bacterium]